MSSWALTKVHRRRNRWSFRRYNSASEHCSKNGHGAEPIATSSNAATWRLGGSSCYRPRPTGRGREMSRTRKSRMSTRRSSRCCSSQTNIPASSRSRTRFCRGSLVRSMMAPRPISESVTLSGDATRGLGLTPCLDTSDQLRDGSGDATCSRRACVQVGGDEHAASGSPDWGGHGGRLRPGQRLTGSQIHVTAMGNQRIDTGASGAHDTDREDTLAHLGVRAQLLRIVGAALIRRVSNQHC